MNQLEPFAQVRNERPCSVSAEMRARQLSKIRDLAETVEAAGFLTLDEQAKILGLPRSTAWFGAPPSTRMYFGSRTPMPVSFKDILEALEFVSASGMGEHQAFLCKQSGRVYWHSEFSDELDELPDDIEDSEKYVPIPDKKELDLGKPLVLDFARQFLPNDIDEVRRIFSRKGAYARFKDLLDRRGALDHWYNFEAKVEEKALRMWCDLNSIEVGD